MTANSCDERIQKCYESISRLKEVNGPNENQWNSKQRQLLCSFIIQIDFLRQSKGVPKHFSDFLSSHGLSGKPITLAFARILSALSGIKRSREVIRYEDIGCIFIDLHWQTFSQFLSNFSFQSNADGSFDLTIAGTTYQCSKSGVVNNLPRMKRVSAETIISPFIASESLPTQTTQMTMPTTQTTQTTQTPQTTQTTMPTTQTPQMTMPTTQTTQIFIESNEEIYSVLSFSPQETEYITQVSTSEGEESISTYPTEETDGDGSFNGFDINEFEDSTNISPQFSFQF